MSLHFLRPEWFYALIPLALLAVWTWRQRLHREAWAKLIDAELLEHLLGQDPKSKQRRWWWLGVLLALIVIVALSGPAWRKLPLPVFKQESALVVALDLSQSMNAADFRPSRLARARLKLIDLLKLRREGQTALIAYAADAFTVSPLTDDSATIQSLVSSLDSSIMPAQGSRADLAVARAIDLLRNAGQSRGDILLVTDGLRQEETDRLSNTDVSPYRVSILAVGTADGAPIPSPDGSGFVKDRQGSIVIARSDHAELQQAAKALGGEYQRIRLDDSDITQLQALFERQQLAASHKQTDFNADRWAEEGPWLLLLALPLAALLFRRGVLLALVIGIAVAQPEPSYAESGWDWSRLWLNNDQRAQQRLAEGDSELAAEQFNNPDWKAAAQYRAGQYEQALQQWQQRSDPDALYNRGNTLAQMGRLEEALASYDELLARQPEHEDAAYNRDLVEQALKQQQQQQQQQSSEGEQSQQGENAQSQDQSQPSQQADSGEQSQQSGQESSSDAQGQQADNAEAGQSGSEDSATEAADQNQSGDDASDADKHMQAGEQPTGKDSATAASDQEQSADPSGETAAQASAAAAEDLTQQVEAQWLRRIPDDPGGLLRNKFRYQYSRQPDQNREEQQW